MKNKNILYCLMISIFIGLDYVYMNVYYSFAIFGYFLIHYLRTRSIEKHSIVHYFLDFVVLPVVFKIVLINMLHWLEMIF